MILNIDDLGVVGIVVDDWDIAKEFKPKTITTDYSSWITYNSCCIAEISLGVSSPILVLNATNVRVPFGFVNTQLLNSYLRFY